MATYTDAALVERLIKKGIGFGSKPDLDATAIADLINLAGSGGSWTSEGIQSAVAAGWSWKAGLTAPQYDLSGQGGAKLTRSQWHKHCRDMALLFRSGGLSVDGETLGNDLGGTWGEVITIRSDFLTGNEVEA